MHALNRHKHPPSVCCSGKPDALAQLIEHFEEGATGQCCFSRFSILYENCSSDGENPCNLQDTIVSTPCKSVKGGTMSIPKSPSEESLNRRILRLDSQIKIEYDLIGHRVSWLLASNSFLIAAFAVVLNNSSPNGSLNWRLAQLLMWLLPITGSISCIVVARAVSAAHSVINELKKQRDPVEDLAAKLYSYERLGVSQQTWYHIAGNRPPTFLPLVVACVWGTVLAMLAYAKLVP